MRAPANLLSDYLRFPTVVLTSKAFGQLRKLKDGRIN
jgi:hypothetical protein